MKNIEFIEQVAKYVCKYAPSYNISVNSPIIAQAILESAWGTSEKAKHHNYFGLKYRPNRVKCHNGYFNANGSEQSRDGVYVPINTDWYSFKDMEHGIEGYFQFININNYSNLKGVTDPKKYLENLKADGYATSINYVDNLMRVIKDNDLTRYDKKILYCVQCGAFANKDNAEKLLNDLKLKGFDGFITIK